MQNGTRFPRLADAPVTTLTIAFQCLPWTTSHRQDLDQLRPHGHGQGAMAKILRGCQVVANVGDYDNEAL